VTLSQGRDAVRGEFSKVSSAFIVYSQFSSRLTFENFVAQGRGEAGGCRHEFAKVSFVFMLYRQFRQFRPLAEEIRLEKFACPEDWTVFLSVLFE